MVLNLDVITHSELRYSPSAANEWWIREALERCSFYELGMLNTPRIHDRSLGGTLTPAAARKEFKVVTSGDSPSAVVLVMDVSNARAISTGKFGVVETNREAWTPGVWTTAPQPGAGRTWLPMQRLLRCGRSTLVV